MYRKELSVCDNLPEPVYSKGFVPMKASHSAHQSRSLAAFEELAQQKA
jgi:hypothetical protein